MASLLSTAVERVALTGQVQQLMSLPGQLPLDQLLRQVAQVLGIKVVHLVAECVKGLVSARLAAKLEAKGRARWLAASRVAEKTDVTEPLLDPKQGLEMAAASKLLVVEAAPKALVEGVFGVRGPRGNRP